MNGQFKNFNCLFFICKRRHDIKAIMYNFPFSEEGKSECFCLFGDYEFLGIIYGITGANGKINNFF